MSPYQHWCGEKACFNVFLFLSLNRPNRREPHTNIHTQFSWKLEHWALMSPYQHWWFQCVFVFIFEPPNRREPHTSIHTQFSWNFVHSCRHISLGAAKKL